uniref:TIGR03773 family transporter-associated surface protein n=1 Tax=Streptomyces sp. NBC_01401 TaxID=2903854 RepID=A0AAU3GMD5_9ACTN
MRSTALRHTVRALSAAVCVTLSAALPAAADGAAESGTATGRTVISTGHVDIGPRFAEDGWTVQIHDGTADPAVWRDTDDVVLQVGDPAKIEAPGGEEFGFLGDSGDDVWVLPQAQQEGVVWPGWNSQDAEVTASVVREVTWELTDVTGPGDFVLFLNGTFGAPETVFDSTERLPQETGIDINTHVHGNWAFTEPGTYLLDMRMKATTKEGKTYDSRRTLHFSVGPQDPEKAFTASDPAGTHEDRKTRSSPSHAQADGSSDSAGSSTALWWGIGAVAIVAAAALIAVRRRRRGDREGPAPAAETDAPAVGKGETDEPA